MPEGPCWSRSARASRSTMSIPRRSPRTVRIATPTAGRLYWTRSGAACSSSLYRIRREFRHRKTSWKDWLEPWPEHCRSEPRLACPTTAIQATTRNPRKTSGTTEGAAKLCCGVPGRQASRGGRQRRAAAPRDAPPPVPPLSRRVDVAAPSRFGTPATYRTEDVSKSSSTATFTFTRRPLFSFPTTQSENLFPPSGLAH